MALEIGDLIEVKILDKPQAKMVRLRYKIVDIPGPLAFTAMLDGVNFVDDDRAEEGDKEPSDSDVKRHPSYVSKLPSERPE